jgi:hypothetical protein
MTGRLNIRRPRLDPAIVIACFLAVFVFDALSSTATRNMFERIRADISTAAHGAAP